MKKRAFFAPRFKLFHVRIDHNGAQASQPRARGTTRANCKAWFRELLKTARHSRLDAVRRYYLVAQRQPSEHQLRQEVRRLPPPRVNSRRARHAAPSRGLLRLRLRPTTTTTPVLRPALSPPPPPLRFLILHGPGQLKLREGRGRRARGSMQPLRTVYPRM